MTRAYQEFVNAPYGHLRARGIAGRLGNIVETGWEMIRAGPARLPARRGGVEIDAIYGRTRENIAAAILSDR